MDRGNARTRIVDEDYNVPLVCSPGVLHTCSAVGRLYTVAGWMTFAHLELVSRIHHLAAMNRTGP